MSKKAKSVSTFQAQIDEFDRQVAALNAEASAEAHGLLDERMAQLRAARDSAQRTLVELQLASESAGASMQSGIEKAWETMHAALKKASADVRK